MNKQQIIEKAEKILEKEAYTSRVHKELRDLEFDSYIMDYEAAVTSGKAFAMMELLAFCLNSDSADEIYNKGVELAKKDISDTIDLDRRDRCIKLLNLIGYDGETYYSILFETESDGDL